MLCPVPITKKEERINMRTVEPIRSILSTRYLYKIRAFPHYMKNAWRFSLQVPTDSAAKNREVVGSLDPNFFTGQMLL